MDDKRVYLTIEEAAKGFKVKPEDVLEFICKGVLKGTAQTDGTYKIAVEDYQTFGQSLHRELIKKVHQYTWERMLEIQPKVQKEVALRFHTNSQVVLARAEKAVVLIECFHKKYEPRFDVFDDKCGKVAGFIVYARVISLLHSILNLLRNAIPSESLILFRPLWEAILLAEYFTFSDAAKKNSNIIQSWFEDDKIVGAKDVRRFLDKEKFLILELTTKAQEAYSKPMHHTYRSIMGSYRAVTMSGMGDEKLKRFGFDYNRSTVMRDIVEIITPFERLLLFALQGFKICFTNLLDGEELKLLNAEIDYYGLDDLKRIETVFAMESIPQKRTQASSVFAGIYSYLTSFFSKEDEGGKKGMGDVDY